MKLNLQDKVTIIRKCGTKLDSVDIRKLTNTITTLKVTLWDSMAVSSNITLVKCGNRVKIKQTFYCVM